MSLNIKVLKYYVIKVKPYLIAQLIYSQNPIKFVLDISQKEGKEKQPPKITFTSENIAFPYFIMI